ncbi:hypothetical protein FB451DRAFT_1372338 [Mycena latifolia]|nr:hypothetical protein FB451DRAFT_1372338 [Mycena latifolia]
MPDFCAVSSVRQQRILLSHTREPVPPRGLFLSQDRREQRKEVMERPNVYTPYLLVNLLRSMYANSPWSRHEYWNENKQ